MIFFAPIVEEVVFRYVLQTYLLTILENKFFFPGGPPTHILEKITGATFRIAITSALFSLIHLVNKGQISDAQLEVQMQGTLILGVFLGTLRETAGLPASIVSHMMINLIQQAPNLVVKC